MRVCVGWGVGGGHCRFLQRMPATNHSIRCSARLHKASRLTMSPSSRFHTGRRRARGGADDALKGVALDDQL